MRPAQKRPEYFTQTEPAGSAADEETAAEEPFLPPAPEPIVRAPRMPEIDELPPIVQQQIRAQRGEPAAVAAPQAERRKTLLEKLAAFGINRHEGETQAAPPRAQLNPSLIALGGAQAPAADAARMAPRPVPQRPAARGQLDPMGRSTPRPPASDDDQLEIPAFLRRQPGG